VPPAPPGKIDPSTLKGTIVFVSDRAGHLDLWRMKASGKDAKPLTNDAHPDADPRFSPDGKTILYTTLRGGFPEVWTMKRDGSGASKVCTGSQGAWSPDGKSVLLIRDNQAWVRELASGAEKKVVPDAWERCGVPAWHPDGRTFAVASRHEETIGIYLLSVDGKENRRLATSEGACTPFFSKDGKKILFQTVKGRIHQMGIDGKDNEAVTFGADIQHDGRYSPDGRYLLFARAPAAEGPWQVCVADLQSDDLDSVVLTKEGSNSLPDWSAIED
jgi:Tol biopolymer transport system component